MNNYHLAQVNIAQKLAPLNDPIMQDFVNNIEAINAIADESEGFVWRLQDEDKNEAAQVFNDDSLVINISVWKDLESLFNYTYNSGHIEVFKRKKEWFSKMKLAHMAFWYVPVGYIPNFKDAKTRLDYKRKYGDTPYSFSFKKRFTIDDFLNYQSQVL